MATVRDLMRVTGRMEEGVTCIECGKPRTARDNLTLWHCNGCVRRMVEETRVPGTDNLSWDDYMLLEIAERKQNGTAYGKGRKGNWRTKEKERRPNGRP